MQARIISCALRYVSALCMYCVVLIYMLVLFRVHSGSPLFPSSDRSAFPANLRQHLHEIQPKSSLQDNRSSVHPFTHCIYDHLTKSYQPSTYKMSLELQKPSKPPQWLVSSLYLAQLEHKVRLLTIQIVPQRLSLDIACHRLFCSERYPG